MEASTLLTEALGLALLYDAGHFEVILTDLVAQVVIPQALQVSIAPLHLAHPLGKAVAVHLGRGPMDQSVLLRKVHGG
jgi:hypothetical protein